MDKKYWFSVFIQDSELINEFDELRKKGNINLCEYAVNMFCGVGFEDNEDNYTDYKPYCAIGSDIVVDTYDEYTFVVNNAIGGCYMLYRKATDDENKWVNDMKK